MEIALSHHGVELYQKKSQTNLFLDGFREPLLSPSPFREPEANNLQRWLKTPRASLFNPFAAGS
jgi:hypothetical protein